MDRAWIKKLLPYNYNFSDGRKFRQNVKSSMRGGDALPNAIITQLFQRHERYQGSKLEAVSQVPMAPKGRKPGVKFMTTFKIMIVKTKFIVAKYD